MLTVENLEDKKITIFYIKENEFIGVIIINTLI